MKLTELGEFGLISRIAAGCVHEASRVIKGIGDDCAATRGPSGFLNLVTTDMLVEGVHFLRERLSPHQLGAKAMAVNLSDIAAMGGEPLDAYVSIAVPRDLTVEYVDECFRGMKEMAARFAVNILGGDTCAAPRDLAINIAVTGRVEEDLILYRSGARVGDRVYVGGSLGDSAAGLDALRCRRAGEQPECTQLISRHLEPVPQIELGRAVATSRLAHAMIDVSDGLSSDLGHLCEASGVGCEVRADAIPISPELAAYADRCGCDPLTAFALDGGEDYVLLIAGDPLLGAAVPGLIPIGVITSSGDRVITAQGSRTPLRGRGWDHFTPPEARERPKSETGGTVDATSPPRVAGIRRR